MAYTITWILCKHGYMDYMVSVITWVTCITRILCFYGLHSYMCFVFLCKTQLHGFRVLKYL